MRLAVLCSPDSWYFEDLTRASRGRHQLLRVDFAGLASEYDGQATKFSCGEHRLDGLDAVLVRTMPPGSLEQVVYRMDLLQGLHQQGTLVVNPPRCVEAAVDKYLCTARIAAAGLRTPRTFVCQTADQSLEAYRQLGGDVVVKPLFGGEGRGIFRVQDEDLASRAFHTLQQLKSVVYMQEFIPHEGYDVRLFLLGDRIFGMRRSNPRDFRTNVSRGANTEPFPLDDHLERLARSASEAVGAIVAGVDVLPGRDGHLYVIEVNAVPGWKALARTLNLDIASLLLDEIQARVRK
jgi:ribosomal protein S6--L-glutamate ligase